MGGAPGWLLGTVAAAAVGAVAHRAGALTPGGAVAAAVVGGVVFGWGGVAGALPLLFFFLTGTGLSRWQKAHKAQRLEQSDVAGRRAGQVLANGAVAAACVAGGALWPAPLWWTAFGGAIAAATADTWATELGVVARRTLLITTLAPAPPGRSGAVSVPGTAGGTLGAVLAAAVVAGAAASGAPWRLPAAVGAGAGLEVLVSAAVGGVAGMLADSLLGATVQERFYCPACRRECELPVHRCGTRTRPLSGWRGFNNDLVNFCATLTGAVVAAGAHWLLTAP